MTEERSLWKGSPSQWLNLGPFIVAVIVSAIIVVVAIPFPPAFIALVLPMGYLIWRFLVVRTQVYELTNERLRITSGVINQKVDEIELYRVKDSQLTRPWWMRLTGLSAIVLETSDRSMPTLRIPAIGGGVELREALRKEVEIQRDRKRVRELDFEENGGDSAGDA